MEKYLYLLFLCCTLLPQGCIAPATTSQSCPQTMNSLVCLVNDKLARYDAKLKQAEIKMRKEIDDFKSRIESLEGLHSVKAADKPTHVGLANVPKSESLTHMTRVPSTTADTTTVPSTTAKTTTASSTTADTTTVSSTKTHDCSEIHAQVNRKSGLHTIQPGQSGNPVQVFCDFESHGAGYGWTVIQRRQTGRINFDRNWADYKEGFGDLENFTEFWLGNENIFQLTATGNAIHRTYTLHVTMTDFSNDTTDAEYDNFRIASEAELYKLNLNFVRGGAEDSLGNHNEMNFSTKDRDHDNDNWGHCAERFKGGFWYKHCLDACLNCVYKKEVEKDRHPECDGIVWRSWKECESLQKVEMKIRPSN